MTESVEKSSELFKSVFKDDEMAPIPVGLTQKTFFDALLWGKSRKVSDFVIRSEDRLRGDVGGGWRRISDRIISHEEVTELIRAIDTPTSPSALEKGHDIDRRYAPEETKSVSPERTVSVQAAEGHGIISRSSRIKTRIRHRFRINITQIKSPIDDSRGYELTIRTLPSDPPLPAELGLEQEFLDNFFKKNSLSLVTGGTGNGKSTLLYSIFKGWVEEGKTSRTGLRILDFCKPIEYVINDPDSETFISQTEVGEMLRNFDDSSESAQWQYSGRNSVRRRPDVINIGETRDRPTFETLLTAANTGHFTSSTMHNNSCPSALQRGLRFFGFEERLGVGSDLMDYLNCIVNQELVLGVDGRTRYALREYIVIDDKLRSRIKNESNVELWPGLMHQAMVDNVGKRRDERSGITQTKYEHALRRLEAGEIGENVVKRMQGQLYGMKESLKTIGPQKTFVDSSEIDAVNATIGE